MSFCTAYRSFFFSCYGDHRDLHSFPTRRSSDLCDKGRYGYEWVHSDDRVRAPMVRKNGELVEVSWPEDRKSTRLNSSHVEISYAVFCLKKKKQKHAKPHQRLPHHHGSLTSYQDQ